MRSVSSRPTHSFSQPLSCPSKKSPPISPIVFASRVFTSSLVLLRRIFFCSREVLRLLSCKEQKVQLLMQSSHGRIWIKLSFLAALVRSLALAFVSGISISAFTFLPVPVLRFLLFDVLCTGVFICIIVLMYNYLLLLKLCCACGVRHINNPWESTMGAPREHHINIFLYLRKMSTLKLQYIASF